MLKRASPLFAKSGQHVAHHRHPRDTRRHRAACDRPANGQCHGVQGRDHAFRHEANLLLGCEENGAPPDKPGVKVSKQIERVRESAIAGSANRGQPWNLASRRNFTYLRAQAYRVTRLIVRRPVRINRPSSPSVVLSIPVESSSCDALWHIMALFNFSPYGTRFGKMFRNSKQGGSRGGHARHYVKCTCAFDVPVKPCLWYHLSDCK